MHSHQFDGITKVIAGRPGTRRLVGRFFVASLLAGTLAPVSAGKPRGKSAGGGKGKSKTKGKGKGKGKGTAPKPKDPCDTSFGTRHDRDYCRFIRRQCDGSDPREFCITEGDITDPAKVAVCCEEGEACCGDRCCPVGSRCCGGKHCCPADDPDIQCCDSRCIDTRTNDENCGVCGRACGADEICLNAGCVCTGANCECRNCTLPGLECCPGLGCVFVAGEDPRNCGGCGVTCPTGQRCFAGRCGCAPGYKYCPLAQRCVLEEYTCCGGLPGGYCFPPFPCCGSGAEAFCSPYLTCP